VAKQVSVNDVVDELLESILAAPKQQRRLRSRTFWGRFDYRRRTHDRVEAVHDALRKRGIVVTLDGQFGTENDNEWILLSHVDAEPTPPTKPDDAATPQDPLPPDDWFAKMETRDFDSEREVEFYFIVPLLERLGYDEDDLVIGHRVNMWEGVHKVTKEADVVVFDGANRASALMVAEAKRVGRPLTEDVIGQAHSYAMWLATPYYLVTNGHDLQVNLFRGTVVPDVRLMEFNRKHLRTQWPALYQSLNRAAVLKYKQQLMDTMPLHPPQ
jgi:hypothetical protein